MDHQSLDFSWIRAHHDGKKDTTLARELFSVETARQVRSFHRQIQGYAITRLISLPALASMMKVGGIYVKDESRRLELNSFKVMGGSFALYRFLQKRLGLRDGEVSYAQLTSREAKEKLGTITFASATDGNHGRGVAWAARELGHKCVIYVHSETSQARINAIRSNGATVRVIPGTYDDAVRQVAIDAEKYGWEIISDTSWSGYTEVPTWIMQGYTTMLLEAQEQFSGLGIVKPTHVFVQAGVGALAASVIGFYSALFPDDPPVFVVVEPEKAACCYKSAVADDGLPHSVTGDLDTICAGLACGDPSPLAWKILKEDADFFVKVPDYIAARGMRIYAVPLRGDEFIISGESGAVTLGAFYSIMTEPNDQEFLRELGIGKDSRILFINTEGNTDPVSFRQIIWDGVDAVPKRFLTRK